MRRAVAVTAAVALLAGGCDSGGGGDYTPITPAQPAVTVTTPGPRPIVGGDGLPAALAGSWSGDDSSGQGSWTLQLAEDGDYRMTNERRGVRIDGTVAVDGSRLVFRPEGAAAYAMPFALSGGRLSLNGDVYLRTGGGSNGAVAQVLLGQWLNLENIYKTLTFASNGTFQLDDPVNGTSSGRFTVSGNTLTLSAGTPRASSYAWSVSDGFLRLRYPDGRISEYTRGG